ncbi:MAG: glucose-6-phosphate isomerase, partial [Tatlockia sp.]|nr:glucose-6-phosphate isomerase [Tatlockia sp.]
MDAAALWQRYQNLLYYNEGLGFYLDVSRMRFDDAFVETLQPKFEQAFAAMADLEKGGIANPDENRMVGHYWLRNPDLAPTPEIKQD